MSFCRVEQKVVVVLLFSLCHFAASTFDVEARLPASVHPHIHVLYGAVGGADACVVSLEMHCHLSPVCHREVVFLHSDKSSRHTQTGRRHLVALHMGLFLIMVAARNSKIALRALAHTGF